MKVITAMPDGVTEQNQPAELCRVTMLMCWYTGDYPVIKQPGWFCENAVYARYLYPLRIL